MSGHWQYQQRHIQSSLVSLPRCYPGSVAEGEKSTILYESLRMVYRQRQNVWDKSLIAIKWLLHKKEYEFILQKEPFSSIVYS